MSNLNQRLGRLGLEACAGALSLLLLTLFACPNVTNIHAVDEYTGITNESDAQVLSNTQNTDTRVWVKPTISIALGANLIDLDSTKGTGNFVSGTTNLKVATNSTRGFKILVNSVGSTNLVATDDTKKTIPTIGAKSTSADFPDASAWGYYADAGEPTAASNYYPASLTASEIKSTDTSSAVNDYKVGIGVKVDNTTPLGIYQNQLVVSAVANPISAFNLASITRMQDMTPDVCAATPNYNKDTGEYAWKNLIDDRTDNDGNKKTYRVAKLADGNCWMQQNLAYSLGKEMTGNDTDIAPNAKKTLPATSTSSAAISTDNNNLESRHPNSYWYYTWRAATADSGTTGLITAAGQIAPDSICPKGWQLPLSGTATINGVSTNTDNVSGSFKYLLNAYSITNQTQMINSGEQPPLSFVRAGFVNSSGVVYVGSEGFYWSRVASSGTDAYDLNWDSSGFNPSYSNNRYDGFSVRCVARREARV